MKRFVFIALSLAFVQGLAGSCAGIDTQAIESVLTEELLTIHAVSADTPDTKTILQDGHTYWVPGDEINVFYGTQSSGKFTSVNTQLARSADFQGIIGVVEGHAEASNEPLSFWGVYPYNAANTCEGNSVSLTIATDQEAAEGTFANGLNAAVAKSYGLKFSFFNVGSFFIFSVGQSGIVSATLRGNNGENLAGKVRVSMDSDDRPACTVIQGSDYIKMVSPAGGFVPGKEYRMVLIPQTLENGYSLTLQKGSSYATFTKTGSALFARNSGRSKLNADQGLVFSGNISFTDATVKSLCVANWDTDHDGKLSFEEAAAVTDLGTVFQGTSITSFDELQYFTNLTAIPSNAFQGCGQLTHIVIPNSVQTIGENAFKDCTSLTEITIPASVTSIGAKAFSNCPNLLSMQLEPTTPPTLGNSNALSTGGALIIRVPESAADAYGSATNWKTYATSMFSGEPEYVDMGLSVKWATCNVGASSPDKAGNKYAWGSLVPTTTTDQTNYYAGTEQSPLPAERDIAAVAYGGTWRMPSKAEWHELRDNSTWEYDGSTFIVTSKINGASITILPGGHWVNDYYSASSAYIVNPSFSNNKASLVDGYNNRKFYYMIRPVRE